ncbi:MAG: PilX N-terminal domain-containing pilus assembly protein [Salinisphaera sp.]|uniref:pilus assembly PilX family protein n=1 Tax=Salinisphaera sp. TaxID=1914330 RepID=UPI003C7C0CA6
MSMRPIPRSGTTTRQDGFILVTSLIFLVILTLLAVSAINSSTLQERMAANQREKSRALDAADSALRHVETLLASSDFRACNPVMNPGITSNSQSTNSCNANASGLAVIPASSGNTDSATYYLSDQFWSQTGVSTYQLPGDASTSGLNIQYVVEYVRQQADDLNPGSAGTTVLFRITARARGRSPGSRAVVQSVYQVTT